MAKNAILWLGLLLCGYALWRNRDLAGVAFSGMSDVTWLFVALLLLLGWGLSVTGWRFYLLAYTGQLLGWRTAMRQQGILLVGKYVPGGVFGFLARMYDQPRLPRKQLFWAGLTEQAVGVALSVFVGGVLYFAASRQSLGWLCLVLPLPLLAVAGIWLLHHFSVRLPWLRRYATGMPLEWRQLLSATSIQLVQLLTWVTLVAMLAQQLHGVSGLASLGVAGAFLLAVAVGVIVIIAPGGIGVREATLVGLSSLWLGTTQAVFLAAFLRLLSAVLDGLSGVLAAMSRSRTEVN